MYNLLSYQPGTVFTGAEIKEWARQTFFTTKDPQKKKISAWVLHHYNLLDKRQYSFHMDYRNNDTTQIRVPIFMRHG